MDDMDKQIAALTVCTPLAQDAHRYQRGVAGTGNDRTHVLLNIHGWEHPPELAPYVHQVGPHKFIPAGVLACVATGRELPPVEDYGHE